MCSVTFAGWLEISLVRVAGLRALHAACTLARQLRLKWMQARCPKGLHTEDTLATYLKLKWMLSVMSNGFPCRGCPGRVAFSHIWCGLGVPRAFHSVGTMAGQLKLK